MLPSTKQYLCDCGETKDYRVTKNCHYMSIQPNTNVISSPNLSSITNCLLSDVIASLLEINIVCNILVNS